MEPTEANRIEFTITLPNLDNCRLSARDLDDNEVTGSSPHLQVFQERLRRKRYINAVEDVRALVTCCRPADLRFSRHMGRFWGPGSSQRLWILISRTPSPQWKPATWTT